MYTQDYFHDPARCGEYLTRGHSICWEGGRDHVRLFVDVYSPSSLFPTTTVAPPVVLQLVVLNPMRLRRYVYHTLHPSISLTRLFSPLRPHTATDAQSQDRRVSLFLYILQVHHVESMLQRPYPTYSSG